MRRKVGMIVKAKAKRRGYAVSVAEILADKDGTTVYFTNTRLPGDELQIGFDESRDRSKPKKYSVPLFFGGDLIACDHDATYAQAMAYIFAVLSAKTAEEAARG